MMNLFVRKKVFGTLYYQMHGLSIPKNISKQNLYFQQIKNCNTSFGYFDFKSYISQSVNKIIYLNNYEYSSRSFHTSPKQLNSQSTPESPPLPRLIYFQNPFVWMVNKFDLKILEKAWDPSFKQAEFTRGSKQAISKVMQIISEGNNSELRGLLTKSARAALDVDFQDPEAKILIPHLALEPYNLKIATPRRVRFLKYEDRKFCDVDMMFVGLKWLTAEKSDGLMYMEIFASFRREYTPSSIPDWTIVFFKITKFQLLDRQ